MPIHTETAGSCACGSPAPTRRMRSSTPRPTGSISPSREGAGSPSAAAPMSHLPLTDDDREAMLQTIGAGSIEELFADLPAGVRLDRELDLSPALTEPELTAYFEGLADQNERAEVSFLGAGLYDHYVPAVVDAVLQRGEFLTAYTPYQPELSQGVLQAIFEYQTAICELTGL